MINPENRTGAWLGRALNLLLPSSINWLRLLFLVAAPIAAGVAAPAIAAPGKGVAATSESAKVAAYWTAERRRNAIPRDLVIDPRGLAYLRGRDGALTPYGHAAAPQTKPTNPGGGGGGGGGGGDSTPPSISNMDPGEGTVIGGSHAFSAVVTDASGVKSVTFTILYPNGVNTQSFNASKQSGDTWGVNLQGFTDGNWGWWVVAKDNAKRGGNTATSATVHFTVDTGGGSPPPTGTVTSAVWSYGGAVQTAAGRIYFEMPANPSWTGPWQGYVCSGTVVDDGVSGRSVILTAAHCVYDDANKAFARNVLFIPDQAETSASGTDLDCTNDPIGCWVPSWGVVDVNWTLHQFPDNIPWDYAHYVVDDTGAHVQGLTATVDELDQAAGSLPISFLAPYVDDGVPGPGSDDFTDALGYSYDQDPNFMYCAEDMTTEGAYNWWLPSCELSGGSSGGPWVQPMDTATGSGPVISVNSWGYTNSPGMAGPKLAGTSASCVYEEATVGSAPPSSADGEAGTSVSCP